MKKAAWWATPPEQLRDFGELFQFGNGSKLRDQAIKTVSEHNETWLNLCLREAEHFCQARADFTGEDIRLHCCAAIGHPRHHNAWGALINCLIKRGIIRPTGEYRPMKDDVSHARKTPVYEAI